MADLGELIRPIWDGGDGAAGERIRRALGGGLLQG